MKGMVILSFLLLSLNSWSKNSSVQTVSQVDLERYLGEWYEIAAIPQSFQKMCVKNVMAQYSLTKSGLIKVVNSCETKSGEVKIAHARAKVEDQNTKAKLKVTFVKIFNWVFALGGNYWVLDLASDYSYAVVGDPSREYGWILSRSKTINPEDLKKAKEVLFRNGYDVCQFMTTIQDGGEDKKHSLCQ